jgi:hypothetical protein
MAKTRRLGGERLRELARIGAEVTLRRLRAEIVAIERAFPELKLPARRRQMRRALQQGIDEDADDVSRSASRGFRTHDALLGRTAQGPGEGQVVFPGAHRASAASPMNRGTAYSRPASLKLK